MAKRLSDKQYAAVTLLSAPNRGGLTLKEVAERVGIAESTLHEWRKQDAFNDAIKSQVLKNAVAHLPDMFDAIPRHVIEEGNAALFRTYIQALGMLTDKVEVTTQEKADVGDMKAQLERLKKREDSDNE